MANKHLIIPVLTEQDIIRFWAYINKTPGQGPKGDCWEWQRGRRHFGHGGFWLKGHTFQAHRIAFSLCLGYDPTSLCVCHSCDNPPCCNPAHLFLDTLAGNVEDMTRKGRAASGDKNGARLHPTTRARGSKNGNSKLSEQQVRQIRITYAKGHISQRDLAARYRVARSLVTAIISGVIWKHA